MPRVVFEVDLRSWFGMMESKVLKDKNLGKNLNKSLNKIGEEDVSPEVLDDLEMLEIIEEVDSDFEDFQEEDSSEEISLPRVTRNTRNIKDFQKERVACEWVIPEEMAGLRLDQVVAKLMPEFSRALIQEWIKAEKIKLNGVFQKTKFKVSAGDKVFVDAEIESKVDDLAEEIPLNIVFEDEDVLVINKPVGLVVHPGAGNASGTLMNALLFHCPALRSLPRAGIVHRLDKDTSGLMVVAKTHEARQSLIEQLQIHDVSRVYIAFVHGYMVGGFTIEEPIGRHPRVRTKMAVVSEMSGKPAVTHVRVLSRSKAISMLEVSLETGRTHQIRVHLSYKGYPLVGDLTYGGRRQFASGEVFEHHALHAKSLSFAHPRTEDWLEFDSEIPGSLLKLQEYIQTHPGH